MVAVQQNVTVEIGLVKSHTRLSSYFILVAIGTINILHTVINTYEVKV